MRCLIFRLIYLNKYIRSDVLYKIANMHISSLRYKIFNVAYNISYKTYQMSYMPYKISELINKTSDLFKPDI